MRGVPFFTLVSVFLLILTAHEPAAFAGEPGHDEQIITIGLYPDSSFGMFLYETILGPKGFNRYLADTICAGLNDRDDKTKYNCEHRLFYSFPDLLQALKGTSNQSEEKAIDMAIASISVTEGREKAGILFSTPYHTTPLGVVFKDITALGRGSSEGGKVHLGELENHHIGVGRGTTAANYLERYEALVDEDKVVEMDSGRELFEWLAVTADEDKVVIYDYVRSYAEVRTSHYVAHRLEAPEKCWSLRFLEPVQEEKYAVAFPLGRKDLRDKVTQIIDKRRVALEEKLRENIEQLFSEDLRFKGKDKLICDLPEIRTFKGATVERDSSTLLRARP